MCPKLNQIFEFFFQINLTSQLFSVGLREWGFIASGVSGRRICLKCRVKGDGRREKGRSEVRESQTGWNQGQSWNSKDRHVRSSFILWTHRACGWMDMFIYTGCLQERWGLIILTNGANFNSSLCCKFPSVVTASVLDKTLFMRLVLHIVRIGSF